MPISEIIELVQRGETFRCKQKYLSALLTAAQISKDRLDWKITVENGVATIVRADLAETEG